MQRTRLIEPVVARPEVPVVVEAGAGAGKSTLAVQLRHALGVGAELLRCSQSDADRRIALRLTELGGTTIVDDAGLISSDLIESLVAAMTAGRHRLILLGRDLPPSLDSWLTTHEHLRYGTAVTVMFDGCRVSGSSSPLPPSGRGVAFSTRLRS